MSGQGDKHTEGWTYLTLLNPCGYDRESQKCCTKVKKNHYQENLFLYFHICWKKKHLPSYYCLWSLFVIKNPRLKNNFNNLNM